MVDPIRAFSRQQPGLLKLTVTKDRRGYLHHAHEVRVDVEDGVMALTFERVAVEQDAPDLAGLSPAAPKVLEVLRASESSSPSRPSPDGVTARFGHGLQRTTASEALKDLSERHLADGEGGREGKSTGGRCDSS
jgi:hypothetical protein